MTGRVGRNGPDVACHDCGQRLLPTGRVGPDQGSEWYMVHDPVWDASGLEPLGGCLCLACLEARLGRPLVHDDLTDHPINTPSGSDSERMRQLKLAALHARGRGII
jgi:hypothetical protein